MKTDSFSAKAEANVLLVEQFPLLSMALHSFFKEKFPSFRTSIAPLPISSNFESGSNKYDIIVLGIVQDDEQESNIRLIRRVGQLYPKSKIMLCEIGSPRYEKVPMYLKEGVFAYISLTGSHMEFANCFNNLINGLRYVNPEVLTWFLLGDTLANGGDGSLQKTALLGNKPLTEKESIVARQLISGKRITHIANDTNRKVSTISTIKKNIFRKTQTTNVMELKKVMSTF